MSELVSSPATLRASSLAWPEGDFKILFLLNEFLSIILIIARI